MGSVADIRTSGDNEPEIFPVRYYMHYLYCDQCGSFELDRWIEPDNHQRLTAAGTYLGRLALLLLVVTVGLAILELPGWVVGLWVALAALALRAILNSKIKERGLRCARCGANYAHGSGFFSALNSNPRRLTMSDVPRPLYRVQQIRGEELGPAPLDTPPSRLPG